MQGSFSTLEQSSTVDKVLLELEDSKTLHKSSKKSFDKEFAAQLYATAPESFLKRTSIKTLDQIYLEAKESLSNFSKSKNKFYIDLQQVKNDERRQYSTLFLAIEERAFVVDTLLELANISKIEPAVILYPTFQIDGSFVTLVYAEFEQIVENSAFEKFSELVKETYSDLVLLTDDFKPMLERCEEITSALDREAKVFSNDVEIDIDNDLHEIAEFLNYCIEQNFVFMGYRSWQISKDAVEKGEVVPTRMSDSDLGIFKSTNKEHEMLADLDREVSYLLSSKTSFLYSRYYFESKIHRHQLMNILTFKTLSEDGMTIYLHSFIGLVKYFFLQQSADVAPITRRKLEHILKEDNIIPGSYDDREVRSIFRGISRLRILQGGIEFIRKDIELIFENKKNPIKTEVLFYFDVLDRFASIMVVMPRTRFSDQTKRILQQYLENEFDVDEGSTDHYVIIVDHRLVRVHYLIPNRKFSAWKGVIDENKVTQKLIDLSYSWKDQFLHALSEEFTLHEAKLICEKYSNVLPGEYKEVNSATSAVEDIRVIEALSDNRSFDVKLSELNGNSDSDKSECRYLLTVYQRGSSLELSDIFPRLQNVGFHIHFQTPTEFFLDSHKYSMHKFCLSVNIDKVDKLKLNSENLLTGLTRVLSGSLASDRLNSLLILAGLSWREIVILRVMEQYLLQIRNFRDHMLVSALINNKSSLLVLLQYFRAKFDPSLFDNMDERKERLLLLEKKFHLTLKDVARLLDDQILRAFLNVMQAAVRTNYYKIAEDDIRIGIKFDSSLLENIQEPKLKYEVFIYTPQFQGIHLRGGKVARGGIRWSDRSDVRKEVLGLVEAQMVKNTIIVPVGAKGGFYIRSRSTDSRILSVQVESCYKDYIRTLLELTDNYLDGKKLVHPESTVIYDDADPYLFIAADKGTAHFSDIANEIAEKEFNFWLADAFASGGSAGYNHKEIGITSGTAWIAAERHFREIGIDVHSREITAVGIGDMSGDVFGNGMLHSDKIKLIAAFNHKHIFIDPSPNPKISFQERKRLFELPRSNWTDYNEDLLSVGGGIYARDQKEIKLSKEAQVSLGISSQVVSGAELISIILKAPVDLLWNGGIGTYVRSSSENDLEIGDRANDDVRVVARELRAKVVAEGGNRGFTQKARIEYSKIGGRINTDAVDNSGGVDLSDREVQLKILLSAPLRRGELTLEDRNKLLASYANEARDLVYERTYMQSQAISVASYYAKENKNDFINLIYELEKEGLLNRKSESLPDDKILEEIPSLTRPDICVLIAYARRSLRKVLIQSSIIDDPYMKKYLKNYFPEGLREKFLSDVLQHPVWRDIIATRVTNTLVERMGLTFITRLRSETGSDAEKVVFASLVANAILGTKDLFSGLREMDRASEPRAYIRAIHDVGMALDQMARWILTCSYCSKSIAELSEKYSNSFQSLFYNTELQYSIFPSFEKSVDKLMNNDFPKELSEKIVSCRYTNSFLDIVQISIETKEKVENVARLYASVSSELFTESITERIADIRTSDHWDLLAIRNAQANMHNSVGVITRSIIQEIGSSKLDALDAYFSVRKDQVKRYKDICHELQKEESNLHVFLAASSQLSALEGMKQ